MKEKNKFILYLILFLISLITFILQVFVFEAPNGFVGMVLCLIYIQLLEPQLRCVK